MYCYSTMLILYKKILYCLISSPQIFAFFFFFFQKSYFQVKQCVYTHSKTAILWSQAEILLSSNELIRILVQLMHDENQTVVEIQYKKKIYIHGNQRASNRDACTPVCALCTSYIKLTGEGRDQPQNGDQTYILSHWRASALHNLLQTAIWVSNVRQHSLILSHWHFPQSL